jgi:hypothetical protein
MKKSTKKSMPNDLIYAYFGCLFKSKHMEKFTQLKTLIADAESDAQAFYEKSNKAAGTRLRNTLQQIKVAASDIRKEVTEKKNSAK